MPAAVIKSATRPAVVSASHAGSGAHDFIRLDSVKPQTCALVFGDSGCGKTTFAVRYAPSPLAIINFDSRAGHAILKAQSEYGKDVRFCKVPFPASILRMDTATSKAAAQKAVDATLRNFEWAIAESIKGNVRSICFDTVTEFAELVTISVRGRLDQQKSDYGRSKGVINRQLLTMFDMAREGNAHFIALSRAAEIWTESATGGGKPSGQFRPRCPDVVQDAVDWSGHLRIRKLFSGARISFRFELEIKKAGVQASEMFKVYSENDWGDMGPFAFTCMQQYPGVDVAGWL